MRQAFLVLFTFFSFTVLAQQDTAIHLQDTSKTIVKKHPAFEKKSTIASVSLGFVDYYKQNYTLPAGYVKGNTTGFTPLYLRLEYAAGKHISIGATFGYDAFVYNFAQQYTGNSGAFTRYKADDFKAFSAGVMGYYHFGSLFHLRGLDPFIGIGGSVNNIRHSGLPQGDTAVIQVTHPVTGSAKIGARYYLSQQFSLYGDVGYDQQSVFSIGASCRFFKKHKTIVHDIDADGDGVPDKADSCPHQKGLAIFDGCPDSDGDGIPDNHDRCPDVAGPADNNGCPYDTAGHKTVVTPAPKVVVIPRSIIQFAPGTAEIKDSSIAVLDSIATVLKNSGKTDVAIEGYLAAGSEHVVGKKIANARIVAVKKYLVDKGIVATRMVFISRYNAAAPPKAKKKRAIVELVYDVTN